MFNLLLCKYYLLHKTILQPSLFEKLIYMKVLILGSTGLWRKYIMYFFKKKED